MDLLMTAEEIIIYSASFAFSAILVVIYLAREKKKSARVKRKVDQAKEEGRFEPVSLHPYVDLNSCIGSGACIKACPEKDILGLVNGKATVINATSCVGHGACLIACPVEAISLRIGTEKRGVDLPHVKPDYETNVPGIYIAGELGGMGLIKNSAEQGIQAVENIARKKHKDIGNEYDVLIVGAGPAGIAAGLTAKKHNLKAIILEQDSLGGTVYSFPREKIVMTRPMELPLYGKVKLFDTSKDELLNIWKDVITKHEINIVENCKVEAIENLGHGFEVKSATGKNYRANTVVLAIGRRGTPRKLGVPGENLPKVYYRLLDPEHINNKDILVVGGGDSAIESAMLLMDNNRVTLSYRSEKFARIKPKNLERITQAISDKKLAVIYNSNVMEIAMDNVKLSTVENPAGEVLANDLVYVFAGGELPTQFLKNAGIEVEKQFGKIVRKGGS